jgi:hypothetical protein
MFSTPPTSLSAKKSPSFLEASKCVNQLFSALDYEKLAVYLMELDLPTREALGKDLKQNGIIFNASAVEYKKNHPEAELIAQAILHKYLPTYSVTQEEAINNLNFYNDHLIGIDGKVSFLREVEKALFQIICSDLDKKPSAHYLVKHYLEIPEGKILIDKVNAYLGGLKNLEPVIGYGLGRR